MTSGQLDVAVYVTLACALALFAWGLRPTK